MLSTNLFNKNKPIDISLYFLVLDQNIYKDSRFTQLLDLTKNSSLYIYSCYTDSNYLSDNIYIPVFHTLYLSSKHHNVIINTIEDAWLVDAFPNNSYYIIGDLTKPISNITPINHLSEVSNGL